jgi:coenzyme PQQ precursor peptide PqqA
MGAPPAGLDDTRSILTRCTGIRWHFKQWIARAELFKGANIVDISPSWRYCVRINCPVDTPSACTEVMRMKWETPSFEEITASAEVTAYVYSK